MKRPDAKSSYIVRFFAFLTNLFYTVLTASPLGRLFSSYSRVEDKFRASGVGRFLNASERGGSKTRRAVRRRIALAMENSLLVRKIPAVLRLLCGCSLRTFGSFFITTGVYAALLYGLFTFVWQTSVVDVSNLFWGIGFLILGILLLFSDASLGFVLTKSLFFGKLLVSGLGISDDSIVNMEKTGKSGYVIAVPLGMAMGALSALTSPVYMLIGFAAVLLFLMVLSVPESGVVLMILFLPFVGFLPKSNMWAVLLLALPLVAYFGKLLRGNRSFHVEVQDLPVLLMMLMYLLSGVSVAGEGAWKRALLSVLLLCGYFLAVNMIATPRWMNRCRVVLILSAAVSGLIGIVQFIFHAFFAVDGTHFTVLAASVSAGFDDRVTFSYFMVIAFPFALAAFVTKKNSHRIFTGLALLLIVSAAVLAWVPAALLAMAVMALVFLLVHERRAFPFVLLGGALLPLLLSFLPSLVRNAALELLHRGPSNAVAHPAATSGIASRIFFERGAGIFSRGAGFSRLLFGLGAGGFERFCVLYTATPAEQMVASLGFWSYRLLEGGILGVLLPAAFFFLMYQSCFTLLRDRREQTFIYSAFVGIMLITGVLVFGIFHYTWYDPAALALFFAAAALVAADARSERGHVDELPDEMQETAYAVEVEY